MFYQPSSSLHQPLLQAGQGPVLDPSRTTRKSYGPRVPNRTMVAKFDHRSALLVSELKASSPRSDENRWQGKPQPLRNHTAANRAAGAEARTISAQSGGLESKKTSGHGEVFFLDFPLYRTNWKLRLPRIGERNGRYCAPGVAEPCTCFGEDHLQG
jgi:hypothetical protein